MDEEEMNMKKSSLSTSSRHDMTGLREFQVSHICDIFNAQLTSLCTDVKYITECMHITDPSFISLHRLITSELRPYVQRMCTEMVSRLVHSLRDKLTELQSKILETTDTNVSVQKLYD